MLTDEQKWMLDTVYPAASETHGKFLDAELLQLGARVAFGDEEEKAPIADAITLEDCQAYLESRRLKPGRPVERDGRYRRITLEIREDLLKQIDTSGKSRREYIETLLEQLAAQE